MDLNKRSNSGQHHLIHPQYSFTQGSELRAEEGAQRLEEQEEQEVCYELLSPGMSEKLHPRSLIKT